MLSASQDALEVMLVTVSSNFTDATQVSEGTFLMWLWRLVILMVKTSDLTSGYLELPSGLVECPTQLIYIFFFLCWVGGGVWWRPLYAAVKSLSPHCDQEGQGRDNFFSKCIFYARSYGGNVKNRSKKCEEPSVIGPESSIPDLKSNSILFCGIIAPYAVLSHSL